MSAPADSIASLRPFITTDELKAYDAALYRDDAKIQPVREEFTRAAAALEDAKQALKKAKARHTAAHRKYFGGPLYPDAEKLSASILSAAKERRCAHLAAGGSERFETAQETAARVNSAA
jgi:hypothetical protein